MLKFCYVGKIVILMKILTHHNKTINNKRSNNPADIATAITQGSTPLGRGASFSALRYVPI